MLLERVTLHLIQAGLLHLALNHHSKIKTDINSAAGFLNALSAPASKRRVQVLFCKGLLQTFRAQMSEARPGRFCFTLLSNIFSGLYCCSFMLLDAIWALSNFHWGINGCGIKGDDASVCCVCCAVHRVHAFQVCRLQVYTLQVYTSQVYTLQVCMKQFCASLVGMALCQHRVSEVRASFWTHVKDLVMSLLETEFHDGRPGSVNAAMGWCI